MNPRAIALAAVLLAFSVFNTWVIAEVGLVGIFATATDNPGSTQVFVDLCISLVLLCGFLAQDARERGLRIWPWLVAVPMLGSVSPLGYLVYRELNR